MAVHNFIWKEAIADELFHKYESEDVDLGDNNDNNIASNEEVDACEQLEMTYLRDAIADAIAQSWYSYLGAFWCGRLMRCSISGMEPDFLSCYMIVPNEDCWSFLEYDVAIALVSFFSSIACQFSFLSYLLFML